MSTSVVPRETPEQEELHAKQAILAELESQLADMELELANVQSELTAFNARYLRTVGCKFAELDRLEAEIAARLARAKPNDEVLKSRSAAARARAEASRRAVEESADDPATN